MTGITTASTWRGLAASGFRHWGLPAQVTQIVANNNMKTILKYRYIPFLLVLTLWIITSFSFDRYDPFLGRRLATAASLLLFTLIPIIYSIIDRNKQDVPLILIKLSKLPFLIIAAHIAVQISGRTYTDKGGWWMLYLLLAICLPLSLLLYVIGLGLRKHKQKYRDTNQTWKRMPNIHFQPTRNEHFFFSFKAIGPAAEIPRWNKVYD